jgi:hypothetical protein
VNNKIKDQLAKQIGGLERPVPDSILVTHGRNLAQFTVSRSRRARQAGCKPQLGWLLV